MATFGLFDNAKARNISNTFVSLYTAPALKRSFVIQLDIASTGNTGVQIDVVINDGSNDFYLGKAIPVPIGSALEFVQDKKIVLKAGETIKVRCATPGEVVDAFLSFVEDVNA